METIVSDCQKRSLDEINTVLEFAKLSKDEVKPVVQSIYFSNELDNDAVKLLELDSSVLNALTQGDEVVIRGEKDEGAVLCTNGDTFDIKDAEMSNSMLMLPGLMLSGELADSGVQEVHYKAVTSVLHNYFELRPCKPRLKKMKMLLEKNMFSGLECEEDDDHKGPKYTFEELLNLVQASESEIRSCLTKLKACEIDGRWRLLHFDFLTQVLSHIIQLCEENDWLKSGLPLEDCCQTLEQLYPRNIIEHVVTCYANKISPTSNNDEDEDSKMEIDTSFYCLDEDKVCRFFAELCLQNSGKFNLQEFLAVWQQSVPTGMNTNIYQIHDMALIDKNSRPEIIWYFPVDDLPEDIGERFDLLFRTREKWSLSDITPFIKNLTTEKLDVGAMLTKYARASMQNGIKVFNSKKRL